MSACNLSKSPHSFLLSLGVMIGITSRSLADSCAVFIPELKGRSPEEVNLLFDLGIPARTSAKWHPENVENDLAVMAATQEPSKGADLQLKATAEHEA